MKKLLLFAGLPAVGKTTISQEVGKRAGAKIIDLDDFKKTDVDPVLVKSQIDPPELRWSYYQKALDHVFSLYDQGVSTLILDEVFHLSSLRSKLEALCGIHGVSVMWIEIRCPYDIVKKRLESKSREGHILSTEESLNMHSMFKDLFEDFPVNSRNHIVVNNVNIHEFDVVVDGIVKRTCLK